MFIKNLCNSTQLTGSHLLCGANTEQIHLYNYGGAMNYGFMIQKTAEELYTSVRMYDKEYHLEYQIHKDPDLSGNNMADQLLRSPLLQQQHDKMPLLFFLNERMVFAWVVTKNKRFLIGPVVLNTANIILVNKLELVVDKVDINSLPVTTVDILASYCTLLYNLDRTGEEDDKYVSDTDILYANCLTDDHMDQTMETFTKTMFDQLENCFAHNPYCHEKLEVSYVKNGDVESLRELLKERFPGRYGTLSNDPIRQEAYLSVVAITLACRAAIAGGMHPEMAFNLSDISIHRIDECKDPVEMIRCTVESELHFARMVHEIRVGNELTTESGADNIHISRCKDYIFSHLHGKITVSQIAAAIGLEESYLSALFKKQENINLKTYILQEKIKLIKNLLTYSTYSFNDISAYLGFSSQSHMGMEFKKVTGMTLREYRQRYSNDDFIKASMDYINVE